jgi:hypothetical protein
LSNAFQVHVKVPFLLSRIGLERVGYSYYLGDSSYAGDGATRNADPYFHAAYVFQDRLTGYFGTRNCTQAHASYAYDKVSNISTRLC